MIINDSLNLIPCVILAIMEVLLWGIIVYYKMNRK